jgi:hypothetical protein
MEVDEIRYLIRNAKKTVEKDKNYEVSKIVNAGEGKKIQINVSNLLPGFYQLYVKIIDKKSKNEYEYKSKFKNYAKFVVDQSIDVKIPDPKTNNSTLAGIDSDNDGIRDDVQYWINQDTFNKPISLKLSLKQYAVDVQSAILLSNDKSTSVNATFNALKSQDCLMATGKSLGIKGSVIEQTRQKIELLYLNTKERIEAEQKNNQNFSGQEVGSYSVEESCDFK